MKEHIQTILRHSLTALAGLGGLLARRELIHDDDVVAVDAAGAGMVDVLVVIVSAIIARIALKLLSALKGRKIVSEAGGSGGGIARALVAMVAASCLLMTVGGALTSCKAMEAMAGQMTGSIGYRHPDSGAKAAIIFEAGKKPRGALTVPVYDPESGEQVGWAELSGPLSGEVTAEK